MRKIRVITCFLTAALVAAAFAGCGETEVKTVDTPNQQEQGQQAPQTGRGTMAKVVSLDGDQLTVILADMSRDNRGGGNPPTDGTPPEGRAAPEGGNTRPEAAAPPDSENGQAAASGAAIKDPAAPAGGPQTGQPRQGGGEIEFTGEEAAYTLSGDVAVMKGIGDAAAEIDLSELAVDDVIRFTTGTDDNGNEVIITIHVME